MEHIIQFAINIDDDAIKKIIMEKAEKQIINEIKSDIEKCIFETNYYGGKNMVNKNRLQLYVENTIIRSLLDNDKENIIQIAAESLAKRMFSSKIVREKIGIEGLKERSVNDDN